MLDSILLKAPVYLIVFVRCFALIMTLPMFSMRSASRIAKVAIAGYMAFFIYGSIDASVYEPYIGQEGVSSALTGSSAWDSASSAGSSSRSLRSASQDSGCLPTWPLRRRSSIVT